MIVDPLITKMAIKSVPALRGGIALVTTFVGLILTDLIFDGFSITGAWTWVAATVIVWLGGMLGAIVLPLIFLRNVADKNNPRAAANDRPGPRETSHSKLPAEPQPEPRFDEFDRGHEPQRAA